MVSKKAAPVGLAQAGVQVWESITGVYELRPDELVTLEDACRLTDMIDALDKAWAEDGRPVTTCGSMGQLVTHPMISEIRAHRMARAALWRQLKLPDVDAPGADGETGPGRGKPNQNRSAAQSRWTAAHGKGA